MLKTSQNLLPWRSTVSKFRFLTRICYCRVDFVIFVQIRLFWLKIFSFEPKYPINDSKLRLPSKNLDHCLKIFTKLSFSLKITVFVSKLIFDSKMRNSKLMWRNLKFNQFNLRFSYACPATNNKSYIFINILIFLHNRKFFHLK